MQSIRLIAVVLTIFGGFATAKAADAPASQPAGELQVLPKPTGPYAVGRITIPVEGLARVDVQKSPANARLQSLVQVWYPAQAGAQGKAAPWIPADRARLEEKGFVGVMLRRPSIPPVEDVAKVIASVVVHAREDVPLAESPQHFPVLLFSSGSQTIPSTYSSLVEDLASRGFVVVGYGPTVMGLGTWKEDLTHLLDQLKVWNTTPGNLFFGRLDLDRIGAFGHSFGASAVSSLAATDKRLKAIVLIDGGGHPEDGRAIPALILKSEGVDLARRSPDAAKASAKKQAAKESAKKEMEYLRKAKPGIRVTILGTVHLSFTDMGVIKAFGLPGDEKAMMDATRAVIGEFFGQYLQAKDTKLFEKGSDKYPLAKIEKAE